jgi:hypothetical protein
LRWCKSYLTNRKQRVILNGEKSDWSALKGGVPQGSVLGPLFFLVFINDLPEVIQYSKVRLFADDSCLILSDTDTSRMTENINKDLNMIERWANKWKVDFSPPKTEAMFFSNRHIVLDPIIFLNSEIKIVHTHKHLGVTLSDDLSWRTHIDEVVYSCSKTLNMMRLLKYKLDRKTLDIIYINFIRPKMEYGNILFAGAPKSELDKLNKIELESIRIITGAIRGTSHTKLYIEYGKASIHKRRNLNIIIMLYNIHNNNAPVYLTNILDKFKHNNRYNLRAKLSYRPPICRTTAFSRSFFPLAIKLWNELPESTRALPTLSALKRELNPKNNNLPAYYYGSRWANVHHARMRMNCSGLNQDLHQKLHVRNSSYCSCGYNCEDAQHYICYCPFYVDERNVMIGALEQLGLGVVNGIPDFKLLLYGDPSLNKNVQTELFKILHNFLTSSKRFF